MCVPFCCDGICDSYVGIVFEDADELFDVEDYDTDAICCPKGSGSGFVGAM